MPRISNLGSNVSEWCESPEDRYCRLQWSDPRHRHRDLAEVITLL